MIMVNRNREWIELNPQDLTNQELCDVLAQIQLDSDEFIPQRDIDEWYEAISEAIRRLDSPTEVR